MRVKKPPMEGLGSEPDVRFSYANERTFLAWNRTALALVAAGLGAISFLPEFSISGGRRLIGVPLIVLGAVMSIASYRRWDANERAMRLRLPLPPSRLGLLLAVGIVLVCVVATVVAVSGPKD